MDNAVEACSKVPEGQRFVAAGALDILLAGDAWYFGKLVKKPTIGENLRTVEAADIMRINRMMIVASLIALVLFLAVRCVLCILLWNI